MDDPRLASMSPDELKSLMRALGYRTQSDLANAIGVSRSAVSLWRFRRSHAYDCGSDARNCP